MQKYVDDILSGEDKPLFEEAVKAFDAGIYRAAYIMFWLSCIESFKRRFREASQRDGNAQQIVGEIDRKEAAHQSVDKFLLNKAKEYGFISDPSYTILENIYALRCVYGHPYEEAPKEEQVINAAAMVVEHVLSKPVKLKHGFAQQIQKKLLEERNFLDENEYAIDQFVKDFLHKIDESIYHWFLNEYWKKLEEISSDVTMKFFFQRGILFSKSIIKYVGMELFSDNWHDLLVKYPKTLSCVCCDYHTFINIGIHAQDVLMGEFFDQANSHPKVLTKIENLYILNVLTDRQSERFFEKISTLDKQTLYLSGLSTLTCYDIIIAELMSYTWPRQNPAMNFIVSNGPEQAKNLNDEQQICLGRNILQCAQGEVNSAKYFIFKLRDCNSWPENIKLGIILETFINHKREIRFKLRNIKKVLSMSGISSRMIKHASRYVLQGAPQEYYVDSLLSG